MASNHPKQTFTTLREFLGNRDKKNFAKNLVIHRDTDRNDNNIITVKYHDTEILRFDSDGTIFVANGGYDTISTKRHINMASGIYVSQQDYQWYINGRKFSQINMITPNGVIIGIDAYYRLSDI